MVSDVSFVIQINKDIVMTLSSMIDLLEMDIAFRIDI
jgi:hypothetical protein